MTQWRQSCLWEDLREYFLDQVPVPFFVQLPSAGPVTPWSHRSVPRLGCGWRDAALSSAAQRSRIFQHRWKQKRLLFNARQKRKLPVHNCCSICTVCFRHLKLVKLLGGERGQWLCHLAGTARLWHGVSSCPGAGRDHLAGLGWAGLGWAGAGGSWKEMFLQSLYSIPMKQSPMPKLPEGEKHFHCWPWAQGFVTTRGKSSWLCFPFKKKSVYDRERLWDW